jgi:hypothetical protein
MLHMREHVRLHCQHMHAARFPFVTFGCGLGTRFSNDALYRSESVRQELENTLKSLQ